MAALAILGLALLVAALFYVNYGSLDEYWKGVATNTAAGFIDIVLVAVGFGVYEQFRRRNDDIARMRERIEDVKRFDDQRAHSILGASMRGLARFGLTDIDLRGAHLTDFSFPGNGVSSIAGAVVSDGFYASAEMKNFAQLRSVQFTGVNCDGVSFGKGNLSFAALDDCSFYGASLVGATFDGIKMHWSADKVLADEADWDELIDEADDGAPIYAQVYSPAFEDADLTHASFKGVRFQHADFRRARNLDKANFEGAHGLETCFFDDGQRPSASTRKPPLMPVGT